MSAIRDEQNKSEIQKAPEMIGAFVQKNRRPIFIGLIVVIAALVLLIIGITVKDKLTEKAMIRVDELNRRYEESKNYDNIDGVDAILGQADITILLLELEEFAKKSTGFPAAKAYSISAEIFGEQKNWKDSENAWLNGAKSAGKSYFAPVCFFNAAVAAEEQGNTEAAIEHYRKALELGDYFPAAARAQFSIGRLEESGGNRTAALEAYANLVGKWPDDPVWANLAQSRIIVLSE